MIHKSVFLLLVFLLTVSVAHSQCAESLGTPILKETFGAGSFFGGPLPDGVTGFTYVSSGCPNDGQYTIANYTSHCYGAWHTLTDHTGDVNGYFMIVNASYAPSDFYVKTVSGLCPGTTYQFSSWVVNVDSVGGLLDPDVTFTIEQTDGTVLGAYDTGTIPVSNPVTWQQYGFNFKTPVGVSTVVLRMHNNGPGGGGNDLGLDDISFAPAGPPTTIAVNGIKGDTVNNSCSGGIIISSTVGSCYLNNSYQWQTSRDGSTWTDIPGATNADYAVSPGSPGTYLYRLTVAENGNIGSLNCRANSNVMTVIFQQYPHPPVNNISAQICYGSQYLLPSGKMTGIAGIYADTLHNKSGCDSLIINVNLTTSTPPTLGQDKQLCAGDSLILNPGTFANYLWQDGTTAATYTVTEPGEYWVKVNDANGCISSDTVHIKISFCLSLKIPNTFTPNGDGINDTWNIKGLSFDKACTVFIYSRWGQLVFKSTGYGKPWDGTYNGKKLAIGTYYYTIDLKDGSPPLAGYITLLR